MSVKPVFPRDIPPHVARLVISYARVIVRMSPERAEVAVRAMESVIAEWRKGNGLDGKRSDRNQSLDTRR